MRSAPAKTAAAYVRVSTDDQVEYSPDAQLAEIGKYAAANGFHIPPSHVYIDEGISGKQTAKRDAFNRMIGTAKLKPKPFDAILLWKYSRFARSREDSIVYKSMLRKQLGIEVISVSEPVGDDKMSVIIEAMIEAMDEYYSLNLAEEVKRGMTEKARRGGLQATPAFGYTVRDNCLVPVAEEAALVRAVFDRFIAGEGLFPIAKWLNELGVTTHRGNRFENRTVEYILRNPVYIGKLRWNPTGRTRRDFSNPGIILADARHEPLIAQAVWEAAQSRMAQVKARWKYHGRPASEHKDWLSGLVRCAECGSSLVFTKPHYWKCNGYARGGCRHSQHIRDDKLKGMILSRMAHDLQPGVKIVCQAARRAAADVDEASLLREQHRQTTLKLARLREAYLAGVEELDSYAAAKAALDAHLATLAGRIEDLEKPDDPDAADGLIREHLAGCLAILKSADADRAVQHAAAHGILEKCVFSKQANTLALHYHLSAEKP